MEQLIRPVQSARTGEIVYLDFSHKPFYSNRMLKRIWNNNLKINNSLDIDIGIERCIVRVSRAAD